MREGQIARGKKTEGRIAEAYTVGIGTVGAGLHFSYDSGTTWRHIYKHIDPEGNVRSLQVFPDDPHHILAVSDRAGLFESFDNGYRWEPLESPITDSEIWSIGIDPTDPDRIFIGARPAAFRSTDKGASWEQLEMGLGNECPIGVPRITNMVVDPRNNASIWAGVEVNGVYWSKDGGDNWSHIDEIGETPFHDDIHGLAIRMSDDPELLVTTPFGLATSNDDGRSWCWREFGGFETGSGSPFAYCRGIFVKPGDPDTMFIGVGDYIPGQVGGIEITRDGGSTWTRAELPTDANATVYWMAMHHDLPDVVVAATVFGQVFASEDSGQTWRQLPREFGEIRSICLSPN